MGEMYNRIVALCNKRGIKPGRVCADTGLSRGMMSDLKMGRTKELSAKNTKIIADYFGVTTDYLLTGEETKKAPTDGERKVSDDDIMFALWGDSDDVDKDDLDDVKRYAAFVRERKKKK